MHVVHANDKSIINNERLVYIFSLDFPLIINVT